MEVVEKTNKTIKLTLDEVKEAITQYLDKKAILQHEDEVIESMNITHRYKYEPMGNTEGETWEIWDGIKVKIKVD